MPTSDGDKRRNRIHLKDAGIPKVVLVAQPNPKGSVPRKPPSVLVALKPLVGNGLPKYMLRSVLNPSVSSTVGNSIPNISVSKAVENWSPNHTVNSVVQNGVNSTKYQKVQNKAQVQKVQNNAVNTNQEQKGSKIPIGYSVQSSCNVPKLEKRKEIKEKLNEPNNPTGNDDNNKTIPNVSAPKSPCPKPSVKENITLRRSNRVTKPNKKYLDVASIISNLKFWNSTPTYNTDFQTI